MKVWPKNEQMRKLLKHPAHKLPFPESGPLDWPEDSFTTRRLADGDVLLEDPAPLPSKPKNATPFNGIEE